MGLTCNWTSDDALTINNDGLTMSSSSIIINNKGFTIDLAEIGRKIRRHRNRYETIEKVIFNDPAVVIIFKDGSKTVAKCSENDVWDPEKGFVIALLKYYLGKSDLGWLIRKYVEPQIENEQEYSLMHLPQTLAEIGAKLKEWANDFDMGKQDERTWDEVAEAEDAGNNP